MTAASGHARWARPAAVLAILISIAAISAVAETQRQVEAPHAIEIRATPIESFDNRDPSRRHFGALEFRGGLQLTSAAREFGGISAIRVASDGAHRSEERRVGKECRL